MEKFITWLKQNGAEILPTTSEYEKIRFKGSEVGVIYKSGKYSGEYAKKAYWCYLNNIKWDGRPVNTGRKKNYVKEKQQLIKRDGKACFYCGNLLGEDITLEHLIPLTAGGLNLLSNMVLAHEQCNQKMSHKGIQEKVCYAIKTRVEKIINKQLQQS